jgi:hypothetical protein
MSRKLAMRVVFNTCPFRSPVRDDNEALSSNRHKCVANKKNFDDLLGMIQSAAAMAPKPNRKREKENKPQEKNKIGH